MDGHIDGPDSGTPAAGARCVTTRRIGGASRPSSSEPVQIDPPRTWGVRGTDGPIRAAVDVLVEPVTDSRSRLTISVDVTGHGIGIGIGIGIGKILMPLMVRREARKEMPDNIAALKAADRRGLARERGQGAIVRANPAQGHVTAAGGQSSGR